MNKIELTEEQIKRITDAFVNGESVTLEPPPPKPEPIELEGGYWCVDDGGTVMYGSSTNSCKDFGMEFTTKKIADREAINMRKRNRLASRMIEIGPEWVPYWGDIEQTKWSVFYNQILSEYRVTSFSCVQHFSPQCSEQTAIQLCEELNSGRFVL